MPLVKLAIRPGINKDNTRYSADGMWADGDKVRFRIGLPEKIGGWIKTTGLAFLGTARMLQPWTTLAGDYILGIGTHLKYYLETGGTNYDVTPVRYTVVVANPFTTTSGSATVLVTIAAHGATEDDFVVFSGATAVGGLLIDGDYQITTILGLNTFNITAASAATSSAVGGGAAVTAAFQIHVGLDTTVYGNGWGAGTWDGTVAGVPVTGWGDAAPVSTTGSQLRLWSNDTYGQDLVINPRDGPMYYWAAGVSLSARAIAFTDLPAASDVPVQVRQVIVSNSDQKVIAFGCTDIVTLDQDRLLIRWSSTAAPSVWTPLETNTSGGLRVPTGSEIITAVTTRTEILVWSDAALHALQYIGAPLEYGITRLAMTSIAGPNAVVSATDVVYWMGDRAFFRYDGRVEPIPCSVTNYVFDDINLSQGEKIFAGANTSYNEVWWFYPSADSSENDRFVAYNYLERVWFVGTLARTAWIDRSIEDYPRATGTDDYAYFHEYGQDDGSTNPSTAISAYIESGIVELGEGENYGFAWRMIPDVTFTGGSAASPQVVMTLKAQDFPGGDFTQSKPTTTARTATIPIEQFTTQTYFRLRGRELTLKVASTGLGVMWRLGNPRIDVRADGSR